MKDNFLVLDVETGGLDSTFHSLLSIGIVFVKNGAIVHEEEWKIKHLQYRYTDAAMKINNIVIKTHDKEAKRIECVKNEISKIIHKIYGDDKPRVIGHNVFFDIGFIHNQLFPKNEWEELVSYRMIDTHSCASLLSYAETYDINDTSLSGLLEYYKDEIPRYVLEDNSKKRHTALYDAKITWCIFERMADHIMYP